MTKQELRELFIEKRKGLSPGELGSYSTSIVESALTTFQMENKMASLFLPIERQKEINTYSLWEKITGFGSQVAVPVMNKQKGDLKHILFVSHDQLAVNDFGVPEPQTGKVIAAHKIDVVFVPLLCFDERGHRVGYGGGYYDRFLKKCNPQCKFIGLSVFPPVDKIDDIVNSDIKLDAVITPEKVYRF
jgi:5-formyltetrahydrofolate cyclo-ligase|tara:strand:- start:15176 stop:15739 length:564 start_codon:yes stop_codon:yes gene_type:complete